ncbi:recombination regulator RecX [Streptococcus sp. S784/96/1]|uniref:recombination regulator RecX n=1 Tax=Streptococcus sp. S784/96/1 TaxID=2653499 RepID=UPI00138723A3|nr:recombination regulator RecX [Streptococcus sp. S784/96/1]
MKITKIEKKKRLYLVEIDSTEKLYVTEDTIVRFMMTKGMVLTPEELETIQSFAQFSYGKNLALYHLSFKKRTEKEVRDYLSHHDIEPNIIPDIIKSLKADKWIDDKAYAQQVIEANKHTGDKGAYVLKQKLIQKGIASTLLDELLGNIDLSSLAEKIAKKLYRKYQTKLPEKKLKEKIQQNLVTRGFNFSQAKIATSRLSIEKDIQLEESLLEKELEKAYQRLSKRYEGYDLRQRLTQTLARKGYDFDDIRSALREYF